MVRAVIDRITKAGQVDIQMYKGKGIGLQSDVVNPTLLVPRLFLVGLETVGLAIGPCKRILSWEGGGACKRSMFLPHKFATV